MSSIFEQLLGILESDPPWPAKTIQDTDFENEPTDAWPTWEWIKGYATVHVTMLRLDMNRWVFRLAHMKLEEYLLNPDLKQIWKTIGKKNVNLEKARFGNIQEASNIDDESFNKINLNNCDYTTRT